MLSMYTTVVYSSWLPNLQNAVLRAEEFQDHGQLLFRVIWAIIPQVGLMFVAVIPSYSSRHGFQNLLSALHAVFAISSMACIASAEVIQLAYGEQAFEKFFSGSWTP